MRPKTKRYSRQQIQEAIRFWTKILESKSPFLDALVSDFGYFATFGDELIAVSLDDIKQIGKIICKIIFKNRLEHQNFKLDEEKKFTSNDVPLGYQYCTYQEKEKCILLRQDAQDQEGNIYCAPAIYVFPDIVGKKRFHLLTLSSMIVHEFIHQHIIENASSEKLIQIQQNIECDFGHTQEFIEMMNNINSQQGLNVQIQGSASYDKETFCKTKEFASDSYSINESGNSGLASIEHYRTGYAKIVLH